MSLRFILFSLLFVCMVGVFAETPQIDSLKSLILKGRIEQQIPAVAKLSDVYLLISKDSAVKYATYGLELARKHGFKAEEARLLNGMGRVFFEKGKYNEALANFIAAQSIYEKLDYPEGNISVYLNIGRIYQVQNSGSKALNYYNDALKLAEGIKNKKWIADVCTHLGNFFYYEDSLKPALDYFLKSVKLYEEIGDEAEMNSGIANVALVYHGFEKYDEALRYFKISTNYYRNHKDEKKLAANYYNTALVYKDLKDLSKAERYLDSCAGISEKLREFDFLQLTYYEWSQLLKEGKDFEGALKRFEQYSMAKDSVVEQANRKEFADMATKYETGKKETENQYLKKEGEQQRAINLIISAGLLLVIAFAFFVFRGYKQKQRANRLLQSQNIEINEQKQLIEHKQNEILDSITYAKRLQEAILPPKELIDQLLPQNFVYYQPKDIVAGDFYWMEMIKRTKDSTNGLNEDFVFIAAADSTGHGVPGAMVSVVCSDALNRAVMQFGLNDPGEILDKTRELVLETFSKSDKDVKDGMDISLCAIQQKSVNGKITVLWSGANNPLWYFSDDEMKEITANKQPIGKSENPQNFTSHKMELKTGDVLFLFTDGFADQFGGPKGKKYKYKQFKEQLIANIRLPVEQQKELLKESFKNWKGDLEQVDDVCVIGIKLV